MLRLKVKFNQYNKIGNFSSLLQIRSGSDDIALSNLGRGAGAAASSNIKRKEDVEFLKANLSALWYTIDNNQPTNYYIIFF